MLFRSILAVACVRDMARSVDWYSRFIGREPDDRPMDGLVQWRLGDGAGLQLVRDVDKAGSSMVTVVVPDMPTTRERLTRASLDLGPDMQGDHGVIAQLDDPDGNRLTLAEPVVGM